MALFDDRRFLLSHINHSFITGDDTGICEVVMLDEDVFENQHQRCLRLEGQDDTKPETTLDPEGEYLYKMNGLLKLPYEMINSILIINQRQPTI